MSDQRQNMGSNGGRPQPGNQQPAKPKRKFRRLQVTVAVIVLVVILSAMYVQAAIIKPPGIAASPPATIDPPPSQPAATSSPGTISDPMPSPTVEPTTGRKPDCYTFILVGTDVVGGNTDTLMVGMIDVRNHHLNIISIPRDTLVDVPWSVKKINSIYLSSKGLKQGDKTLKGIDALKYEVSQLVGFEIDSYIVVDVEGFRKLVDSVGGITFDVPVNMNYDDPLQGLSIHINKGLQQLDGSQAEGVVRFRENNDGTGYSQGDLQRERVQQDFLKTVAKKMLSINNLDKVGAWAGIFHQYVKTNMILGNFIWYGEKLMQMTADDISFYQVPVDQPYIRGVSYVTIKIDEWLDMVNSTINPWFEPRTASDLNVLEWDKTTQTATSTAGTTYGINDFATANPNPGA